MAANPCCGYLEYPVSTPGVPLETPRAPLEYPWRTPGVPLECRVWLRAQTLSHAQTSSANAPALDPTGSPTTQMGAASRRAARSWTALMWAAHCGHVDVMVALMLCGADQSKRAQQGRYSGCALANFSYGRQSCTQH